MNLERSLLDRVYGKSLSLTSPTLHAKIFPKLPNLYSYEAAINCAFIKNELEFEFENYPCIFPDWDNTPRSGVRGTVFLGSTPELFRTHLQDALEQVSSKPPERRIVFVKSWNEWAEGNYLEPDQKFGKAYLEVIKDAVVLNNF